MMDKQERLSTLDALEMWLADNERDAPPVIAWLRERIR